jgi:hypothetical protein
LSSLMSESSIPKAGVYILFEPKQLRIVKPFDQRVVRVGTHGVSRGSKSTLRGRLRTHLGTSSGDGNHRSSILRLHIGASLIAKEPEIWTCPTWGSTVPPKSGRPPNEIALEQEVSNYIRGMSVAIVPVSDPSGAASDRAYIERNMIALLAGTRGSLDPADDGWLGYWCPNSAVGWSSLWNVDFVDDRYDVRFLQVLEELVLLAEAGRQPPVHSLSPKGWNTLKYRRAANQRSLEAGS